MPRTLPQLQLNVYRDRSKNRHLYEPVDSVPDGIKWKGAPGPTDKNVTHLLSTPGEHYKLIRDRRTGDVVYFKRKHEPPATPKEQIDAEPKRAGQVRYRKGTLCWFVDTNSRWFLVQVVDRPPHRIVIKPETGWDADRMVEWGYGELLEFPDQHNNRLFQRLRPLKDRYR